MSAYILNGKRTAIGSFMGGLSTVAAPDLAQNCVKDLNSWAESKGINLAQETEEIYMGNVVTAGVGQAPARQVVIKAGLPSTIRAVTVNKVCGSGLQAVVFAAQSIQCGDTQLALAGGMENMSLAPFLIPGASAGLKFGENKLVDSMQFDGLWDVYSNRAMGNCAEECAKKYKITREIQDEFAVNSFKRAQKAQADGIFQEEITSVLVKGKKSDTIIQEDEGPKKVDFQKIPLLKGAFEKDGTITAANASTINDGAAVLLVGSEKYKSQAEFKILASASHAEDPTWFTIAPVGSIQKCLQKAKLKISDIDLFEINEAFAVVSLHAVRELGLDFNKVNIYGGAISLGHPIGCSGARILVTLMNGLKRTGKKLGLASLCIGGGEALSMIIERIR